MTSDFFTSKKKCVMCRSAYQRNLQPFCSPSRHFADSPPARPINLLCSIMACSHYLPTPQPPRSRKPSWAYGALQKPPWARAVVAPMNYRNDLIVFSFGNTGNPPLCISVLTACGFQRCTWFSADNLGQSLLNPRWSDLSKQSCSYRGTARQPDV